MNQSADTIAAPLRTQGCDPFVQTPAGVAMLQTVYPLSIEAEHGIEALAFPTERERDRYLAAFVADLWDDEFDEPMPDDPMEAIEQYFNSPHNETYEVSEQWLTQL